MLCFERCSISKRYEKGEKMKIFNIYRFILLVLLVPLQVEAQQISIEQNDIMNRITRNCLEMPVIHFPRPEGYDSELREYFDYFRYFSNDLAELRDINPNAESSTAIVHGKPFVEHLANCKKIIESTQAELDKIEASTPNREALTLIDQALWDCNVAINWIDSPEKYNANFNGINEIYERYIRNRDKAISLDDRVKSFRNDELEKCNNNFIPKFLALKVEYENAEEAILQQRNDKAKSFGYAGIHTGFTQLIDDLNSGLTTIDDAKKYLYEPIEGFKVINVLDGVVVYGYNRNSSEYLQLAVVRENGKYYGDGAYIETGLYGIHGIKEFVTVLGARKQLVVLKKVSE
jgi:hypothetical protein